MQKKKMLHDFTADLWGAARGVSTSSFLYIYKKTEDILFGLNRHWNKQIWAGAKKQAQRREFH